MADYYVYSGSISSTVLDAAKSIVSGSLQDYCLFCDGNNSYVLIMTDHFDDASMSCGDCTIYNFDYAEYQQLQYSYTYYLTSSDAQAVTIHNQNDFLYYSSGSRSPDLRGGVEYYAFALIFTLCIGFIYHLIMSIFKHVI